MVEVRACVYFFVLFLSFQVTVGKPFFGLGYCELLCEDDDDATTTTSSSTEDYDDDLWWICGWCEPRRPRTTTTPAPTTLAAPGVTANPGVPPFNVVIPASATATNVTLWRPNADSGWFMNMMPWNMGAPAGPPGPPGPPPPTAAPLVATTAAAAGETPAAAAAAATTAAPAA